ncbi:MAG: oligosaccharide flippase family protein [Gemmatimonadales bacterium]
MSRTRKFAYGVGFGYVNQMVLMAAGLWLTPFLLRTLGTSQYGLWVVVAQVLVYLGLLDFGIVAILPRSVAGAAGSGDATSRAVEISHRIASILPIVGVQTLLAGLAAALLLIFLPSPWEPIRIPITMLLVVYVFLFPLRIPQAVLAGLQDNRFLGILQLLAWGLGTIATVLLVYRGYALKSLAAGWILTQCSISFCSIFRLLLRFPETVPRRFPVFDFRAQRKLLAQGGWVSVAQVAQMLLAGTDVLLIGKLLGAEAVVTYAITGKLIAVLANQPQILMQVAVPGLSEMRGFSTPSAIARVSCALTQGMLLVTGLVVCVVLATNRAFVWTWVGRQHFGGFAITGLMLIGMLLRHLNVSAVYTIFAFGAERRIAIVNLIDGLVSMGVASFLLPRVGIAGAAIGLIAGVTLVSLPANYSALLSITESTFRDYWRPLVPWALRLIPLAAGCALLQQWLVPESLFGVALTAIGVTVVYTAAMRVAVLTSPLSQYLPQRIIRWAAPAF